MEWHSGAFDKSDIKTPEAVGPWVDELAFATDNELSVFARRDF